MVFDTNPNHESIFWVKSLKYIYPTYIYIYRCHNVSLRTLFLMAFSAQSWRLPAMRMAGLATKMEGFFGRLPNNTEVIFAMQNFMAILSSRGTKSGCGGFLEHNRHATYLCSTLFHLLVFSLPDVTTFHCELFFSWHSLHSPGVCQRCEWPDLQRKWKASLEGCQITLR